jgi:hypothetical protein
LTQEEAQRNLKNHTWELWLLVLLVPAKYSILVV